MSRQARRRKACSSRYPLERSEQRKSGSSGVQSRLSEPGICKSVPRVRASQQKGAASEHFATDNKAKASLCSTRYDQQTCDWPSSATMACLLLDVACYCDQAKRITGNETLQEGQHSKHPAYPARRKIATKDPNRSRTGTKRSNSIKLELRKWLHAHKRTNQR